MIPQCVDIHIYNQVTSKETHKTRRANRSLDNNLKGASSERFIQQNNLQLKKHLTEKQDASGPYSIVYNMYYFTSDFNKSDILSYTDSCYYLFHCKFPNPQHDNCCAWVFDADTLCQCALYTLYNFLLYRYFISSNFWIQIVLRILH